MKINNIIYLFLVAIVMSCSAPKISYAEYKEKVSEYSENQYLTSMDAKDSKYSILVFTEVFQGEKINVINGNSLIYDDKVTSDESLGLAKSFRVINSEDITVFDKSLNYSFTLKKKRNMKFKYIYISKIKYDHDKYKIIYSNSLKGFK